MNRLLACWALLVYAVATFVACYHARAVTLEVPGYDPRWGRFARGAGLLALAFLVMALFL